MLRLLGKSKVWGRGYTTIPVTVRRVLAVEDGDALEWYILDSGEVVVKNVKSRGGGVRESEL
jgi:bifunctional DNA-binding transcriptional regulator/antitoxin component of YhaV-PrlF toxin-antitoxin module